MPMMESIHPATARIPPLHDAEPEDDISPAVLFARSIKLIQPSSSTSSPIIIRSFDDNAFKTKCIKSSPEYDPLIDLSLLAEELFKKGEVWTNKEVLSDCISCFAESIGCKPVKSRDIIKIKPRNPNIASHDTFFIKLRALHNEVKPAASPKDPDKSIAKARPIWDREVQIKEVTCVLPIAYLSGTKRSTVDEFDVSCPSTSFAHSLKKYDTMSPKIVGFDEKTLNEKCLRTQHDEFNATDKPNPYFDKNLDMDVMAKEIFKQGEVWVNRDVLYHALSCFGNVFEFKVVKTRNMICCKRYGSDIGNRNWTQGPWKVECTFYITLKALHTEKKTPENPKVPDNIIPKCRPMWEREVLIKEASCVHGGGCKPGEDNITSTVKKRTRAVYPNAVVLKSSGLINLFTKIRDKTTGVAEFVSYSKRIMRLLVEETISVLPSRPHTINTPTNIRYKGQLSVIDTHPDKVCLVSIIRAGDALLDSFREVAPAAPVGKMLIQRDESSTAKEAVHSFSKLPEGMKEMEAVVLCDPMLATGGSSMKALNVLINQYGVNPQKIVFANVISCPEGLETLAKTYPDVKIVTSWVDEGLNADKFILPGLGDYGDRFFNTPYSGRHETELS